MIWGLAWPDPPRTHEKIISVKLSLFCVPFCFHTGAQQYVSFLSGYQPERGENESEYKIIRKYFRTEN